MHRLGEVLNACRVKVAAAEGHLKRLEEARYGFLEVEKKVATLRGETNAQRTKYLFRVEEVIGWPQPECGIIVGDAVHCMRSALDHLVYGIAEAPDRNRSQFPIFRREKDWVTKAPAMLWSVHPGVVAMIKQVQPYHDGQAAANHPLALLAALSNLDKHRTIPTVALVADDAKATVLNTQGIAKWDAIRFIKGRKYELDAIVAECEIVPDDSGLQLDMEVKMGADFVVGFGSIPGASWLDGKPVIPTFVNTLGGYVIKSFLDPLVDLWNKALIEAGANEEGLSEESG